MARAPPACRSHVDRGRKAHSATKAFGALESTGFRGNASSESLFESLCHRQMAFGQIVGGKAY